MEVFNFSLITIFQLNIISIKEHFFYSLAGHTEGSLFNFIKSSRPPNKTQLRLLLIKELAKANAKSIPLNVQISELLNETINYFMPQDRINLLEAKLSATTTAGTTSSASRASLPIREPSRTTNSNPDLDKSMDKLKKLSTIIDLQVGPPNTPERNAFDGRLENLERLKVFITKKMRNVASNYGVTDGMSIHFQNGFLKIIFAFFSAYIQKTSTVIIKVLAVGKFTLYSMRRHLSSYGNVSLSEFIGGKISTYETHFPKGITTNFIVSLVLDYLEENAVPSY